MRSGRRGREIHGSTRGIGNDRGERLEGFARRRRSGCRFGRLGDGVGHGRKLPFRLGERVEWGGPRKEGIRGLWPGSELGRQCRLCGNNRRRAGDEGARPPGLRGPGVRVTGTRSGNEEQRDNRDMPDIHDKQRIFANRLPKQILLERWEKTGCRWRECVDITGGTDTVSRI